VVPQEATEDSGDAQIAAFDPTGDVTVQIQTTTILIYSAITLLGVMAAATAKDYVDDSWDLSVLVVGSAAALAVAHAWAGVLAHVMVRHEGLGRSLIIAEVKFSGLAFLPAALVVADLLVMSLVVDSFDLEVTLAMLTLVALLFLAGYISASRMSLSGWICLKWGLASAVVGLLVVLVKVAFGG
jgi:hypothetical protein